MATVRSMVSARAHATTTRTTCQPGILRLRDLHVHPAPLVEDDTVIVDGVLTTSLARTVLDLSRTIPLAQAVAAGDRALATGLTDADLSVVLARMERWPGVRRARVAASMLDVEARVPASPSAGSSWSGKDYLSPNCRSRSSIGAEA